MITKPLQSLFPSWSKTLKYRTTIIQNSIPQSAIPFQALKSHQCSQNICSIGRKLRCHLGAPHFDKKTLPGKCASETLSIVLSSTFPGRSFSLSFSLSHQHFKQCTSYCSRTNLHYRRFIALPEIDARWLDKTNSISNSHCMQEGVDVVILLIMVIGVIVSNILLNF